MEEKLAEVKQLNLEEAWEEIRKDKFFEIGMVEASHLLDFLKRILFLEPVEEAEILRHFEDISGGIQGKPKFTISVLRKQLEKFREEYRKEKLEESEW